MGDAVARVPPDTFRDHIGQALAIAVKAYNSPKVCLVTEFFDSLFKRHGLIKH